MDSRIGRFIKGFGVGLLQFVGANVVTLLLSFAVSLDPNASPGVFVAAAGAAFTTGVALVGLIALKLRWLQGPPRRLARVLLSFAGVYTMLLVALALGEVREASPLLTASMVVGILAFQLPGWVGARERIDVA